MLYMNKHRVRTDRNQAPFFERGLSQMKNESFFQAEISWDQIASKTRAWLRSRTVIYRLLNYMF